MVAPNGARRTKSDHPALPVTIAETVATARSCFAAGAGGLHAHVRDEEGRHVLDAGLYSELIAEMSVVVPDMMVQITTEAVGQYTPQQQRRLVENVRPDAVSVALREMLPDDSEAEAARRSTMKPVTQVQRYSISSMNLRKSLGCSIGSTRASSRPESCNFSSSSVDTQQGSKVPHQIWIRS